MLIMAKHKWVFPIVAILLAAGFALLFLHHHGDGAEHADCAVCFLVVHTLRLAPAALLLVFAARSFECFAPSEATEPLPLFLPLNSPYRAPPVSL